MKLVPLSRGKFAMVDDEVFDMVSQFKWYLDSTSGIEYARRSFIKNGKKSSQRIHQLILDTPPGMQIDHIDMNGLNNQMSNLRISNKGQNGFNQKLRRVNTSGFKGVSWHTMRNKWRSAITLNGKSFHLGLFDSASDAAEAYDEAAIRFFGAFARTNEMLGRFKCRGD